MHCERAGCGLTILDLTLWFYGHCAAALRCGRTWSVLPLDRVCFQFALEQSSGRRRGSATNHVGIIWSHNTRTGPNYSDGLMYLLTLASLTHQRPTDVNLYNIADPP